MLRHLFPGELTRARAVFETLFPTCSGLDLERFVRETVAAYPLGAAVGLRVAFAAVAVAPIVVLRRPTLFTRLAPEDRLRTLEAFASSDVYLLRSMFTMLKAAGAMACADEVRRHLRRRAEFQRRHDGREGRR